MEVPALSIARASLGPASPGSVVTVAVAVPLPFGLAWAGPSAATIPIHTAALTRFGFIEVSFNETPLTPERCVDMYVVREIRT